MPTYDEKLLADAPEVTKADLQDGYNPDLLREPTVKRTTSARVAPIPPRSNSEPHHHHPLDDLESSATPLQPKEAPYDTGLGRKKQPFWRTTKGIVIMGLVFLAIILAAVLGGVLGSKKKGNNVNVGNGGGQSGNGSSGEGTSGSADGANGANGAGGGPVASAISSDHSATNTVRPSTTVTQPVGGVASGTTGSGNTGVIAPNGGESDSQTGANGGTGTTGGTTTGTTSGSTDPPPTIGTGPTEN